MSWYAERTCIGCIVAFDDWRQSTWFGPDQFGKVKTLYNPRGVTIAALTDCVARAVNELPEKRFGTRQSTERMTLCVRIADRLNAADIRPKTEK